MMNDAVDQHQMLIGAIEDAMASMNQATDALAKFRFCRSRQRVFTEQVERCVETEKVGVRYVGIELIDTEFAYFQKVDAGR